MSPLPATQASLSTELPSLPVVSPEDSAALWRQIRTNTPGFREGSFQTPTGTIPQLEVSCWAQVPYSLKRVLTGSIKIDFVATGNPATDAELLEVKQFLQGLHMASLPNVLAELERKLTASQSFNPNLIPPPGTIQDAADWLSAHGLTSCPPRTFTVTDLLAVPTTASGVDLDAFKKDARCALQEHSTSGRPLAVLLPAASDQQAAIAATLKDLSEENELLQRSQQTCVAWRQDLSLPGGVTEVSLAHFVAAQGAIAALHDGNEIRALPPELPELGTHVTDTKEGFQLPEAPPNSAENEPLPKSEPVLLDVEQPLLTSKEADCTPSWDSIILGDADVTLPPTEEQADRPKPESYIDDINANSLPLRLPPPILDTPPPQKLHDAAVDVERQPFPGAQDLESNTPDSTLPETPQETAVPPEKSSPTNSIETETAEAAPNLPNLRDSSLADHLRTLNERLKYGLSIDLKLPEKMERLQRISSYDKQRAPKQPPTSGRASEILEKVESRSLVESAKKLLDYRQMMLAAHTQGEVTNSSRQEGFLVTLPSSGSAFFVGDLEGHISTIVKLIDHNNLIERWSNGEQAFLCVLGDMVDRSATGSLLVDFLLELKFGMGFDRNVIVLAGNHELDPLQHFSFDRADNSPPSDVGLAGDIFRRPYNAAPDSRLGSETLAQVRSLCPEMLKTQNPDLAPEKMEECEARGGMYTVLHSILRLLPRTIVSPSGAFASHAAFPMGAQMKRLFETQPASPTTRSEVLHMAKYGPYPGKFNFTPFTVWGDLNPSEAPATPHTGSIDALFPSNESRGDGMYAFTYEAAERFLTAIDSSLFIRGHQLFFAGASRWEFKNSDQGKPRTLYAGWDYKKIATINSEHRNLAVELDLGLKHPAPADLTRHFIP